MSALTTPFPLCVLHTRTAPLGPGHPTATTMHLRSACGTAGGPFVRSTGEPHDA